MSSVTKRDYYEVLGLERAGDGSANQERVSQARAEVPPRSQSRRSQGGRSLQGSGGSVRRARRSRRSAACTTASATPASAARAGAGGFDPTIFADFSDIFSRPRRRVRPRRYLRSAPPPRRTAARRRPALRPRDLVRRIRDRHGNDDPDSARGNLRNLQGIGRGGGHDGRNVQPVQGHGSAALPAGIPDRGAAVPELPRHRKDDRQAVPDLPRRGPRRPASASSRSRFPPASRRASVFASTAKANMAPPAVPRATSTSSSMSRSTRSSIVRKTTSTARCR